MLTVAISHPLGRIDLNVSFTATHGLTALVGPSGAGKTSVLEAIAGLLRPASGRIQLNGDVLLDTGAAAFVPPHRRRVGYVSQEPRLFPHLTVRQNLLYGRWFTPAAQRRISLRDMVDLLDLGALLARRPARLSGGEKQRVALGRALLASPRVLLLDEPLAAVDAGKRQDILPYLDRLRADLRLPMLYVTHLFTEISARAEDAIVLDEGHIVASGPPEHVRPELERVLGLPATGAPVPGPRSD
jgi:molybdate transport system ATP-binding protein